MCGVVAVLDKYRLFMRENASWFKKGVCVHTSPDKVGTVATQIYRYTTLLHAGKSRNFTMDRFGNRVAQLPVAPIFKIKVFQH